MEQLEMTGSWFGLVWPTGNVAELIWVSAPGLRAEWAVARVRSSLSVWITSALLPATRSYHMACSPLASAVIQGWKRSLIVVGLRAPLMTCGVLQVLFPSREKLRKTRVAFASLPPTPAGRSFHPAQRIPFGSIAC